MRPFIVLCVLAIGVTMGVAQDLLLDQQRALSVSDAISRNVTEPISPARLDLSSEVDSFIVATMNAYHIPGLSACVIRDGEIIWTGAYGYADIEKNIKVTASTLFSLASISKPVTATALMQLWEDGRFELDEDINNYLPFQVRNPRHPDDPITFRMLLTHTSGMTDKWPNVKELMSWGSDSPIPLDSFLVNYLVPGGKYWRNSNYMPWAPLESFMYSNVSLALVGYLVEAITHTPFEQYCRDNIFAPLGMNETSWFLRNLDTNHIALPYYYKGGQYHSYGHYGWPTYPAAQLRTSAPQLARFLCAFTQMGELDGIRILDSSTVALMTTVQFPAVDPYQGIAWQVFPYTHPELGTDMYVGHAGAWDGANTGMSYILERDGHVGVVNLTNGESREGRLIIVDYLYVLGEKLALEKGLIKDVTNNEGSLPEQFSLSQNYPNPFNPSTTISYQLPTQSHVTLKVFDVLGREVGTLLNEEKAAGNHAVQWDASSVAGGVYLYRLQAGSSVDVKKLIFLK